MLVFCITSLVPQNDYNLCFSFSDSSPDLQPGGPSRSSGSNRPSRSSGSSGPGSNSSVRHGRSSALNNWYFKDDEADSEMN